MAIAPDSSATSPAAALAGVSQLQLRQTLERYFETLNAGEFDQTAALFAESGVLYPPFEEGVAGPAAIATYLHTEAQGLYLTPKSTSEEQREDRNFEYEVRGHVKTPLFRVNVAWRFVLNADAQILAVGIKLLATLEELLKLKQ